MKLLVRLFRSLFEGDISSSNEIIKVTTAPTVKGSICNKLAQFGIRSESEHLGILAIVYIHNFMAKVSRLADAIEWVQELGTF